jgi:hypothetical protein
MRYTMLISLLVYMQVGFTQTNPVPKIEDLVKIPPSPEASAFAKYGNTPANLFTGTPSISVPIASVKGRSLEVPISLNYDASGIKVEQIATWVGLGWNMNVGGMITRQVNGLPDDYVSATPQYTPFYSTTINADFEFVRGFTPAENSIYSPGNLTRYYDFLKKVTRTGTNEKYEIQPDTYSFSALGLSGTFFIDYALGVAYCIEAPELKITPAFQNQANTKLIVGWEIVDAGGNTYNFALAEKTHVLDNDPLDGQRVYNSAWALTSIVAANNRDVIQFNYNALPKWTQPQLAGRTDTYNDYGAGSTCGTDYMIISNSPTYQVAQLEISSIIVNGLTLAQFTPTGSRNDLVGKNALNKITLYNTNGSITSQYILRQSYFGSGTNEKLLRLRLDSVEVYGSTLVNPIKYKFTYYDGLPSRESMAQDYWGYYNGQTNASTLIPYNYSLDKDNQNFQGVKRTPSFTATRMGSLNKITYPTGGSTEFTYGPHQLPPNSFSYQEEYLVGGASLVGGANPADPFNYRVCDDMTTTAPKGIETSFQVTQSGSHALKLNLLNSTPNGNPANHMYFIAMYYAGPTGMQTRTFCDLLNNGNTIFFQYQNYSIGYNLNQEVQLVPGYYRIMMLNTIPSLTIQAEIKAVRTITSADFDGAGLRVQKMIDKDIDGSVVSKRYLYYGDLGNVPAGTINETFVSTPSPATVGTFHAAINFEDAKFVESLDENGAFIECGSTYRSTSNRIQSNYFVTYPVATEIAFDNAGNHNGYSVTQFNSTIDNWGVGFSKRFPNNGKVVSTRVYRSDGAKVSQQRNYYSLNTVVPGVVGFDFQSSHSTLKDMYVKADVATPTQEFSISEYSTVANVNNSWNITHCTGTGYVCNTFSDVNYHTPDTRHTGYTCEQVLGTHPFNPFHPARVQFESLKQTYGAQNVSIAHYGQNGLVQVCYKKYNIISCADLGNQYQKIQFLYSRFWPRLDSTVTVQYAGTDSVYSYNRNLYENSTHFQITGVRQRDSRGMISTSKYYYPHDMQLAFPSDPIWLGLINQHRFAERVKNQGYVNGSQLLATENTIYRTAGAMILPDKKQYSIGTNPLEDRINFLQYDANGNPTELSRSNDMKVSFIYGYNNALPIAQIINAASSQVFYTGFEEGPYDYLNDAYTGTRSKNGFTQSLSGLLAGNYLLTYRQKVSNVWNLVTTPVVVAGSTYTISITGQVDDVRFYPASAQMTTYTYLPGVGQTSVTDANNIATYYEFDTTGRLAVVRDNNLNILKSYTYNYHK